MALIDVWTLTVDDGEGLTTTVHSSEEEAIDALHDTYNPDGEFAEVQDFCDSGLVVYIDVHNIEV